MKVLGNKGSENQTRDNSLNKCDSSKNLSIEHQNMLYDMSSKATNEASITKINERKIRDLNSQTMANYLQHVNSHNSRPPSSSKNKKFISIKVNQKFGAQNNRNRTTMSSKK